MGRESRRAAGAAICAVLALALGCLGAACGGSDGGPTSCTPGARWVCQCGGGTVGVQVCQSDGTYGACQCGEVDTDAGALDGPRADGGLPGDGPAQADRPPQVDGPLQSDGPPQSDAPAQVDRPPQTDGLVQKDGPANFDAIVANGCAAGAADQLFQQGMRGCKGTVSFANRATLCSSGFRVCTAAEWVARRGGVAPTYNYWTNDVLYASGMDGDCSVDLTYQLGDWCDGTNPMRVCVGHSDSLGNQCNWTGCGFNSRTPSEHFGGCQSNPTAGALCCPT
jgi:hypothetical protein